MTESTAVAAPINWAEEFAKSTKAALAQEKPDNKFVSFKSGQLSFNDQIAKDNKIQVVVVGSAFENQFFVGKYDPKNQKSPDCWAVALKEEDLAADAEAVTNQVHGNCAACPNNEWDSDPEGSGGKACKNIRRLAMIQAHQVQANDPAGMEVIYARLPVTSVKNWSKYVVQLGNVVKRPIWGVLTEVSVVPDQKSQFKVNFNFIGLVEEPSLEAVHTIHQQLTEGSQMLFGYPKNPPEDEAPAKAKGKKF